MCESASRVKAKRFQQEVGPICYCKCKSMSKFSNTDVHRPCNNMVTILGMPKYYRPESGPAGTARLYVNNIVKVTEDFISYDLLRWLNFSYIICVKTISCEFQMCATINTLVPAWWRKLAATLVFWLAFLSWIWQYWSKLLAASATN